jgi:hypothetical protein
MAIYYSKLHTYPFPSLSVRSSGLRSNTEMPLKNAEIGRNYTARITSLCVGLCDFGDVTMAFWKELRRRGCPYNSSFGTHQKQDNSLPMLAFLVLTHYAVATYYLDDHSPLLSYISQSSWNTSTWSQAYDGTL